MDEFEVSYSLENEQQFWEELADIVAAHCSSHELIDNALRSYLHFTTKFKDEYLQSDYDAARCSQKLLDSELFRTNQEYVRRQIVYSLLQEDEAASLYIIAHFLLRDGGHHEATFEMMNSEGCFTKLVDLVKQGYYEDVRLHRLLLQLLYEMCRMQRLCAEDLAHVDDDFVQCLFEIIEELSDDVNDPYHYPVIRVLLVLNEQYMVTATSTSSDATPQPINLTNRVIKLLSLRGHAYMTFGENIILLLNRETETSLQLLILKLLYLLFTTRATYEYFYTNDLRVLLDVIIRNLLDLPNELASLRHTYLRVLYPLLAFTQLAQPPHYKREEIAKVLGILGGSSSKHFAPADETTLRLVERVANVPWLSSNSGNSGSNDNSDGDGGGDGDGDDTASAATGAGGGDGALARKLLGISLSPSQSASSVSVVDVAAVMERPGVQTPSRKTELLLLGGGGGSSGGGSGGNGCGGSAGVAAVAELASQHHQHNNNNNNDNDGKDNENNNNDRSAGPGHRRPPVPPPPPTPLLTVNGHRRLPPQAPPPRRRTRLKSLAASTTLSNEGTGS